jgi:hypothetical protein
MNRALTLFAAVASVASLLLVAGRAEAQSLSLTGGMTLLLGPPEGEAAPVLGTPQDGTAQQPPQQPQQPPNTVYIVETQAPPGYGQPGYGQPGYGQPGYGQPGYGLPVGMSPAERAAQRAEQESNGRIPRLIFEPIIGYGVGVSLGALGLLIGAAVGGCFDFDGDSWDTGCVVGIVGGFYIGALLGMPLGVMWAGSWFRGMGSFGATFLGTLAGAGLSILISALVQNYEVVFGAALLPLAGAMIGYELSSAANASAGTATLALTPTFDRGAMTGGTAGVRIAF